MHKDSGWRLFLRTVVARAYPRVIGYGREISKLVIDVGLPLIGTFAYVFVYRALQAPEVFVGYMIVGCAMGAFWLNVMWGMASQFFWERQMGNLALYIIAPTSMMAILMGMAIGGIFIAGLRAVLIVLIASVVFHITYAVTNATMLMLAFVLTLAALYAMGMMFSSLFLMFGREVRHMMELFGDPAFLLTGTYFPVRSLNVWLASAASLIPLTLGLDAMRQLMFPNGARLGFLSPDVEVSALIALTAVFLWGAQRALRYMERLAVEQGKLTETRA